MRVADRSGFNSWLGSVCLGRGRLSAQNLLFWRFLNGGAGWREFCAERLGANGGVLGLVRIQRKSEGLRAFAQSLSTAGLGLIPRAATVGSTRPPRDADLGL